jgi:hypothetical protein
VTAPDRNPLHDSYEAARRDAADEHASPPASHDSGIRPWDEYEAGDEQ